MRSCEVQLSCEMSCSASSQPGKNLCVCVCVAKARRQVKAVKPKKMIRVEGKTIVTSACNAGSSAVVSVDGEVFVFGKDTFHCDNTTGMSTPCFIKIRKKRSAPTIRFLQRLMERYQRHIIIIIIVENKPVVKLGSFAGF